MGRIKREIAPLPPIIGKVKIGEKTERGLPKSVDYFIASGGYKDAFLNHFGSEPKKIPVFFPKNIDTNYLVEERLEWWNAGVLYGYGDGESFMVLDTSTFYFEPKKSAEITNLSEYKHTLKLRFGIRSLSMALGVWQFETKGSKSTIDNILGTLDLVNQMGKAWHEVPFDLIVSFRSKKEPNGRTRKYPVVTLVAANLDTENSHPIVPVAITQQISRHSNVFEEKVFLPDTDSEILSSDLTEDSDGTCSDSIDEPNDDYSHEAKDEKLVDAKDLLDEP